jgi:endonuclease/exonuclease/phosphatase family metal-dependent hydrolase
VLNLVDNDAIGDKLVRVNELQKLIEKATYTPADKTRIMELYTELKVYVEVQVDRGDKFFNPTETKVVAGGSKDFDGGLAFRRARFSEMQRDMTAKVMKTVKADVQCVVEAEDRGAMDRFDREVMNNHFKYALLLDGNDPRGIDVGVYSKLPLGQLRTHIYDAGANGRTIFSRDCPEFEVLLPGGQSLWVLVNHFKSKGGGPQGPSNERRKKQAERVREILRGYDLSTDLVVVAGDLNDTPGSDPLKPLLDTPRLHDVLHLQFGNDWSERWTYRYRGELNQIDYLLVSDPLKDKFERAGVERRGMHDVGVATGGAVQPFPDVTSPTTAASDHAAVWADFNL